MAYALKCAATRYVTVPTLTGGVGAVRVCRFDMEIADLSSTNPLFGNSNTESSSFDSCRIMSPTQVIVRAGSATASVITVASGSIPLNTRIVFEVVKTSTNIDVLINGASIGTASISAAVRDQAYAINYLLAAGNVTNCFRGKIYEAEVIGNTFLNVSDANASTWGTGTLVGYPTDGSQWQFYSASTPIAFTGTVPNQTFTNGQSVSVNFASYFSGTQTPFTFASTGASLAAAGLSLSSAGLLSGTYTGTTVSGVIVTGTDSSSNAANSNAFNISLPAAVVPQGTVTLGTITKTSTTATAPYTYSAADQTGFEYRVNGGSPVADAASPVDLTGLTASTAYTIEVRAVNASGAGTWSSVGNFTTNAAAQVPQGTVTIGSITTTQTTASVPYTYSLADQTGFQYRLNGGTATTATASPQSLTGLTANTAYTVEIRAINATGAGTWSAVKNFTTAAVPVGTITIPDVVNNTNTPWTSAAVDAATVMPVGLGSILVNKTGLSVTVGAELVISDALIVTGTEYIIILKIGTAYGWYRAVAT